jgi:outer membrane beta-barrel protein
MKRLLLAAAASLLLTPALAGAAQGDRLDEKERPKEAIPTPSPTPEIDKANRPSAVEGGTSYVIQKRRYQIGHEFRLGIGYLPMDAFYKGTTGDFGYSYHFNDFFSWEVLRGLYSYNQDTDLRARLNEEFDVENDPYEKTQYMIFTSFRFTPFYGKQTILNRAIVHQELYFLAGPGGVGWVLHENGRSDVPTAFRPAFNIGAGFRWYVSRMVSMRLEAMEDFYQKADGSVDDQIYVNFGISLSTKR